MKVKFFIGICLCLVPVLGYTNTVESDNQIKQEIIRRSIASYPGNCACPYNYARNGSQCGKRSAYSRSGGYDVICYASDVTYDMILQWKQTHNNSTWGY